MARIQSDDGHQVTVISPGAEDGTESYDGFRLHTVGLRTRRPWRDYEFLAGAVTWLRREGGEFDVLHAHGSPHAARVLGRRAKVAVHSVDFFRYRWSERPPTRRVYVGSLRRFDRILPVSDFCARSFTEYYPELQDRVTVLANGVNLTQFAPDAGTGGLARKELGLPDGPLVVYMGRVCEQKGSDLLVGLARWLSEVHPDATVVAAGPPEQFGRSGTTTLVQELSDADVRCTGAVEEDVLPGLLNAAEIFVLPTRRDEMFGMAAVEAEACGTPVVASDLGGIPEAVGPGGLLFPVGDGAGLADRVGALLRDNNRATRLAALGLEHAATFAWRRIVDSAYEIYGASLQ